MTRSFFNLYSHDFARVAVAVPVCRVADPQFNAQETLRLAREAAQKGALLVVFPELGISAYTCDDLFHQRALLDACEAAIGDIVAASTNIPAVLVIGAPLKIEHKLFNCALVISSGKLCGVVPKSYLPNYGEFYEARQFSAAENASSTEVTLCGHQAPFSASLLFDVPGAPLFRFHIEICEDVWVPVPPSSFAALAGATVLVNLSASNIVIGKSGYRHQLVGQQSARCLSAYLYSSAGRGESTTDLAWDGQALIYENGELLAESDRFLDTSHIIFGDVDLERLSRERMRQTTFGQSTRRHADEVRKFQVVSVPASLPDAEHLPLMRAINRFPYVPSNPATRDERCAEVYNIQVQGLLQRLGAANISKVVIGVSGGLDSTQALLVCAKAMDRLKLPRSHILGYTMPGFATSSRTLQQAKDLMQAVGCSMQEIDIRPSCMQMLKDLNHPFATGEEQYDVTFENVQAGERTSHLFRLANFHHAIVIGTGDLSELALGWCTYGVGDHMSHYSVNASVPKTLITHLVRWVAESGQVGDAGSRVLEQILATEISPELVPGKVEKVIDQKTESIIGPYELQDFNLYYLLRFGFAPSKVAFLSHSAWADREHGVWPAGRNVARNQYTLADIKRNLAIFAERFFHTSQFKRSCIPNAPKVGSGGSLSPRGDWRAPSDSEATVWLRDIEKIPD
ncbi:NAD+ synthase (glutamine-hydrolysing) [Paraburkholderia sp. GV068]|uniref:NAD(+) synthase n=1 Tax=unclassified Paraburkholderia TaxID=2615204 RepID=UPI000D30B1DF|nr:MULTISPECIES: NAD(+) synthase [unclassified Paraburkholderia]PTQ97200.1 NAD+ synthase (glutamine-hydrolysing) [Paraburkholderia sp. GV072]PUB02738.1 NAD+ synthase (glutamine-hydrolysing) [Paraburkholderia sp. GV068]